VIASSPALIPRCTDTLVTMAKVVESFPHSISPRIPWRRFTDGERHELKRGVDFAQDPHMARKAFVNWACRNGYSGAHHSSVYNGRLYIQVTK